MFAITGNTYPVKDQLKALGCKWNPEQKAWVARDAQMYARAVAIVPVPAAKAAPAQVAVENIGKVVDFIYAAREHLRKPALLVWVRERSLRLAIAPSGPNVGCINVTSEDCIDWYGRIHKGGTFEANRRMGQETATAIATALTALANDPAQAAREYGHLTGRCCFCGDFLSTPESTALGYGPVCARKWGLAHGKRAAAAAKEARRTA